MYVGRGDLTRLAELTRIADGAAKRLATAKEIAGAASRPPTAALSQPRDAQRRSPAVADIIGARRMRTVAMISSGSIPWR
jgi:hypothetical protein